MEMDINSIEIIISRKDAMILHEVIVRTKHLQSTSEKRVSLRFAGMIGDMLNCR